MPIVLVSERECAYIVVDDYSRAEYTRPLRLKSAVEVLKASRVAVENESKKSIREIMMDNTIWACQNPFGQKRSAQQRTLGIGRRRRL